MAQHSFLQKAHQRHPDPVSAYLNGQPSLRIEQGRVVWEAQVCPGFGLLTFHFDDAPYPVYVQIIDGA
jgi:hypothetical protein